MLVVKRVNVQFFTKYLLIHFVSSSKSVAVACFSSTGRDISLIPDTSSFFHSHLVEEF